METWRTVESRAVPAAIARLEALENDNGALEVVDLNDDEEASLDEEDDLVGISLSVCIFVHYAIGLRGIAPEQTFAFQYCCNIPNLLSKTSPPIYPHQAHNQDH
ncbi:hypothetical protein YC2023_053046 [Brassica napus]